MPPKNRLFFKNTGSVVSLCNLVTWQHYLEDSYVLVHLRSPLFFSIVTPSSVAPAEDCP